jgi:hypothetical protein
MALNWDKVEVMCHAAKGIAFDTCHKIYILLDDEQMAEMKEWGYDPLISSDEMSPEQMFATIKQWYADSCMLRFVEAVKTVDGNPNNGFIQLIPQGAEYEEETYA